MLIINVQKYIMEIQLSIIAIVMVILIVLIVYCFSLKEQIGRLKEQIDNKTMKQSFTNDNKKSSKPTKSKIDEFTE